MRFERRVDEGTEKPYVYLNIGELKLPGLPDISESNLNRLLSFPTDTFKILGDRNASFNWEIVFGTVHKFLDTMTDEENQKFASLLVIMHVMILQVLGVEHPEDRAIVNLETELSQLLAKFDQEVNLVNRLITFTQDNIPIQSFAGAGERPQDSREMTFYRPDAVELTAVALLCKMMTPIFGLFIYLYNKKIDSSCKEVHCAAILRDILYNRCERLINKVNYFISNIIKKAAKNISITHIYNGYTLATITNTIYSQVLTKRFIGVNFYESSSNLVTYITSCARYAVNTQFGGSAFKRAVEEIRQPDKSTTGSDDGNTSSLEVESRVSTKPADYPILIKAAATELFARFPAENDLDQDVIAEAQSYYEVNHISLSPANEYLLGIVFGSYLCGAKSISGLDGLVLAKLIPILQTLFLQQGYLSLLPLVSLQQTGQVKTILSGVDTRLRSLWNSSFEYKNCDSKYTYCVDKLRWDTGLKNLVENIITENYRINLAPVFYEKLGIDNQNGEIYATSERIPQDICTLISQLYP